MSASGSRAPDPSVGIFWQVPGDRDGAPVLVIDATDLSQAERYGEMLTHPRGHYEVYEAWRAGGKVGLKRRGLPRAIAWSEYEQHSRGRIVYDPAARVFTIYADRRLQRPPAIAGIVAAFALTAERTIVRGDSHYRS